MLYEVITKVLMTDVAKFCVKDWTENNVFDINASTWIDSLSVTTDQSNIDIDFRITSYNVCYTKLLRAAAMSLSSVSVLTNALRLKGFKPYR